MCLKNFLFLILFALATQCGAQQYFFRNYSVESGLPFVQVFCMYQDTNGYLWSGGYGGLSRFDGKVFTNYNRDNGLIDHNVNAICVDDGGAIFAGTNKGLSVLKGKKFRSYANFGGYISPRVTSFCKGYHHSIYIGTPRGLYMYKDDSVRRVKKLQDYEINYLYNPDTTVIFIGTDRGLVIFGHNTFKVIGKKEGLASDMVNSITRFRNFLVTGTSQGLSFYDLNTGKITNYDESNGLLDENVTSTLNENNQFLWIGSQSGLLRFDGNQFEYYNVSAGNNSNQIRCILHDRENNIWLGTHSGLYRYRDNSFATFDKESGLGSAFIFQIFRDRHDNLWVTSQNNGIFRGNNGTFVRYGPDDGIKANIARSGLEDKKGRVLFGAATKLVQFTGGKFHDIPLPAQFTGDIDVMYEAHDGRLWLGGNNGVCALTWKPGRPEIEFYPIVSKEDFQVYGFCEDEAGDLYVGTFKGGLYKMERDSLVNLSARLNLNEESFFMMRYIDGRIFAASLNGLLILDVKSGKLKRITDTDGLNSELIYCLEVSRDGKYLWLGTNQGINRLDLIKYLSTEQISLSSYGLQEGFAGVECNGNGIWEDTDGTLWFGTVSGMVRHQPFNYKLNTTQNKTVLQGISVMNEDTLLNNNALLPHDFNTIAFYYRGICLTNPDKVLYQRRLEGLEQDRDWSAPSTDNFIKYTNLPPGTYTFKIRSSNNEGIWNQKETAFTFRIETPYYMTWWFMLLTGGILFALIYFVFMIRIYNIKKKQRLEYERKVEMSKIELKALRAQMNPHFIFNSLNSIQHYIFNTKSEEAIKFLNKFARLVRIILNNSEKPTVTVGEDIEALKLYLELEQMRFEEKFEYEVIVEESVDPDYDIMPPLLMQPYVENAILHGLNPRPVKGKLTIRLYSKNNFLICTITDNGIGRQKAAEIRRTMPLKKHRSMGMKITEDRLRILNDANNSKLSVNITDLKDEQGNAAGTRVEIFVPLGG
jgi:ligand-binding sensor domain-containing protein